MNYKTPTKIVHCKKETYDTYIGRPSKWGNPFSHIPGKGIICKSREEAVQKYAEWITKGSGQYLLNDLHELRGKTLGCWCKPKLCHGDFLVKLVNKYFSQKL